MIYIAHRALFEGYNEPMENHPDQIARALGAGFHVEIDVRLIDGKWWLGHDGPQYEVDPEFFMTDGLWIHCKNFAALAAIRTLDDGNITTFWGYNPNYFWHQNDDYTITSRGYLWAYPGMAVEETQTILVQPERDKGWFDTVQNMKAKGVCSKFVRDIQAVHIACDKSFGKPNKSR